MNAIDTTRRAAVDRTTKETSIKLALALAPGPVDVRTGIGFLDHLLSSLAFHGGMSLSLECKGDLQVDDHHSAEDCAIALGTALGKALGDKKGVRRFGSRYAPLDEALARAVVDLSGRPFAFVDLGLGRESIGGLACENVAHVVTSLAYAANITVHLDVIRGQNDHHRAEAAFKALALSLRDAMALDPAYGSAVPSAKGTLGGPGAIA